MKKSTYEKPYIYEYASANQELDEKYLIDTLKENIEGKKILEDKAKSSLIAITISSTLIFNIVKFMQEANNSTIMFIILASVSFLSLVYMVIAGILSLYSIAEINTVSTMFPEDYLLENKHKKVQIADNIEDNYLHNLKRNNFMTTSYKCMITSISFLIIIFIISTVISFQGHIKKDAIQVLKEDIENINNKISSITTLSSTDRQNITSIQQTLIGIMSDNSTFENKLNAISLSIEDINKIISQNPSSASNEVRSLLLELEKKLK